MTLNMKDLVMKPNMASKILSVGHFGVEWLPVLGQERQAEQLVVQHWVR
jgi:hypothetical protein